MVPLYVALAAALTSVLGAVSLLLLLERSGPGRFGHRLVSRTLDRWVGPGAVRRWDWPLAVALLGAAYVAIVAFDLLHGMYRCPAGGGPSDVVGLVRSGRALWTGGNPFVVQDCRTTVVVPYGLAAVALDALGSLGGGVGIATVWGIVALALVPLVALAADGDRRYLVAVLAASPIFLPVITGEIDGASNAIVPVAVVLAVVLARRSPTLGAVAGGVLSTARFPSLFGVLASEGGAPRRIAVAASAVVAFAAVSALAYARWGASFVRSVFLSQATRHAFSLNAWGVLLNAHALPAGPALPVAQAIATVAVTAAAFLAVRSPLRAASIALVAVALLTQFLSYPILLWLVPVLLVGPRERWWLWGISLVGSLNFLFALDVLGFADGNYGPTDVLDVVVTLLLIGLLLELVRGARADPAAGPGSPVRELEPHLVARNEPEPGVDGAAHLGGVQVDPGVPPPRGPVDLGADNRRRDPPAPELGLGEHRHHVRHPPPGEPARTGLRRGEPESAAPRDAAVAPLHDEAEERPTGELPAQPASVRRVRPVEVRAQTAADGEPHLPPVRYEELDVGARRPAHGELRAGRAGPARGASAARHRLTTS